MEVESSHKNGLSSKSVALIFQIRAIDKLRLRRAIGVLEEEYLRKINLEVKKFLTL